MSALTEFLFPAPAPRTVRAIIGWWESRRLAYNLWVGSAGLVSVGVLCVEALLMRGSIDVRGVLIAPTIFGVMANVCYLLGPTAEILIEKLWGRSVLPTGPTLFRMGLTFSVGLALFPSLVVSILLVVRIVLAVLGIIPLG
jgi:hypothetical protein